MQHVRRTSTLLMVPDFLTKHPEVTETNTKTNNCETHAWPVLRLYDGVFALQVYVML